MSISSNSIISVSNSERETAPDPVVAELKERVRDRRLESELQCCLDRVSYKLNLYDRYGVPIQELQAARSLRRVQDSLEEVLDYFEGEPP